MIAYLRNGDSPRRDVAHPKFAVGQRSGSPMCPPTRTAGCPATCASGAAPWRVFEGDYAYFCHTGDGIGDPMPIYIVEFDPAELWGPRAEAGPQKLYAELFEAYLAPSRRTRMTDQFAYPPDREESSAAKGRGAGGASHREGRHHARRPWTRCSPTSRRR